MAGGIDWFRWHHGSVTDPKFQLIAKRSSASLPDVLAVWAYVLEQASASETRGHHGDIDCEAVDCMFGFDDGQTKAILDAMQAREMLTDGRVSSWDKRQPKRERDTDNSAERTRAYRERQKQPLESGENHVTPCDATERQKNARGEKSREEEKREEKDTSSSTVVGAAVAARTAEPKAVALPKDWQLPKAWGDWAMSEFSHWTADIVRLEADKFADHWRSKSGKDARKADWPATWRNWCRSDIAQRAHPIARATKTSAMTDEQRATLAASNADEAKRLLFGNALDVIDHEPIGVGHEAG